MNTSLRAVSGHHLVAALAVVLPWLALVPLGRRLGLPPVVVLLLVVGVVLPVAGCLLVRHRLTAEGAVVPGRWRWGAVRERLGLRRPTGRQVLGAGVPALVAALLLPGLGLPVEQALQHAGWFAGWPSTGLPPSPAAGGAAPVAPVATLALWVAVAVVLGPVVEEVLFRGLLQPLLPGGPWTRVCLGSALFAAYHLWQPATWATVFLATLPAAWVRERTGSTWLAAAVHVGANAAALALLLTGALRR